MVVGVGTRPARDPFGLELLGECSLMSRVEEALRVAERDGRAGRELTRKLGAALGEAFERHDLADKTALERRLGVPELARVHEPLCLCQADDAGQEPRAADVRR